MSEMDLSRVVAVIPARGGSKRLPAKNMKELAGRSLVEWAIVHAHGAGIDKVAVSSDDEATLLLAAAMGACAVRRPDDIAQGTTPPIWNVRHAMKVLREKLPDLAADYVVYLQPTSPFRQAEDIRSSLMVAHRTGADAVVTVKALKEVPFEVGHAGRLRVMPRSESSSAIVAPNGAVYVIRVDHLDKGHDWWDGLTMAHLMPEERSLDIDVKEDFEAAQQLAGTLLDAGVM